jgi:ech hydrogenase subunit F
LPFMLPIIIKNLLSKPFTVKYPFEKREPLPKHKGQIEFDMSKCDLCQDCERLCPSVAIKVYPNAKVIEYDPFKCIYCHLCVQICMQIAIKGYTVYTPPSYVKEVKIFKQE